MGMRSIRFIKIRNGVDTLHVETPNGIINIRIGLVDRHGREVDSISIQPSNFAGDRKVSRRGDRLVRLKVRN